MCRKLVYLFFYISAFGLSLRAEAGTEVAHWALDNDARDSVGAIHGTLMNGAGFTTDAKVGSHALLLDGIDDYVDFGNPLSLPAGLSARTLCGWGKTNSVAAGWSWIAAYGSPANSQAMFIGKGSNLTGADLYGGGYGNDVLLSRFWEIGVWHHICLTYDGTTARLYADGVQVASAARNWNLVLSRAHLGRQVNNAAEFWDGGVDDVHVYKRALMPSEVQKLANGISLDLKKAWDPSPPDGTPNVTSPIFSWKPGDDAALHDVYFGTNPTPVLPSTKAGRAGPSILLVFLRHEQLTTGGSMRWKLTVRPSTQATSGDARQRLWPPMTPARLMAPSI